MSILKEHIGHMDRDQLSFHQSELTAFFLSALDFRAKHCEVCCCLRGGTLVWARSGPVWARSGLGPDRSGLGPVGCS